MWPLFSLLISFSLYAGSCPLKDGDLVFIKSQSNQSRLLKLTTGSDWTHVGMAFKREAGWEIIEAIQPVKWTSLYSFVRRSRELAVIVKRPTFAFDADKVRMYAEEKLSLDYDLIFAWDQDRWYCSELVWKAFKKTSGEEIGKLEKIGDLQNIDAPVIRAEAKKRFASYGIAYDHETWKESPVITPVQMLNAQNLEHVKIDSSLENLADCVKK